VFDVSLSFKAEYFSRTVFGKTTTDYTKGGRITCKLSKWVQGPGLYGEPADFKYTKTDASGQTVAFDDVPAAVVSEDGTLVWTVGGLDPHDAAALEAGTTYTITFRVFVRDLAYSDLSVRQPLARRPVPKSPRRFRTRPHGPLGPLEPGQIAPEAPGGHARKVFEESLESLVQGV